MSLIVKNLSFAYRKNKWILRNINLVIKNNCITGLFGPNGSGKSTLLRCLNGGLKPQIGFVSHNDERIDALPPGEIAKRIAVVPQQIPINIPFSVLQMVMLGRYAHRNIFGISTTKDYDIVLTSLERVGAAHLVDLPFDELSGGERQKVILAQALAQQAKTLLLDEPASHLDISHQLALFSLLRSLTKEGYTIFVICHDLIISPLFTDLIVLLNNNGEIVAHGPPKDILTSELITVVFQAPISLCRKSDSSITVSIDPNLLNPLA
jgi:iron complex transport system ATP-binding protein